MVRKHVMNRYRSEVLEPCIVFPCPASAPLPHVYRDGLQCRECERKYRPIRESRRIAARAITLIGKAGQLAIEKDGDGRCGGRRM